jgi:hypothetical protein
VYVSEIWNETLQYHGYGIEGRKDKHGGNLGRFGDQGAAALMMTWRGQLHVSRKVQSFKSLHRSFFKESKIVNIS